jgi:hypothetical protein
VLVIKFHIYIFFYLNIIILFSNLIIALGSSAASFYHYGLKYWDFAQSAIYNSTSDGYRHIGYYFTQAVWKSSTQVGFGFSAAQVNGLYKYFSVTWYNPAGNIEGQYAANVFPYKA